MVIPPATKDRQLQERLRAFAGPIMEQIKCEFADEIAREPKAFKASLLCAIRQALPLRRGRPNDPRIDAAIRMLDQGKSVKEILRLQTRGFDKLDTYGRYLAEKGLRAAIARRRERRGLKRAVPVRSAWHE